MLFFLWDILTSKHKGVGLAVSLLYASGPAKAPPLAYSLLTFHLTAKLNVYDLLCFTVDAATEASFF